MVDVPKWVNFNNEEKSETILLTGQPTADPRFAGCERKGLSTLHGTIKLARPAFQTYIVRVNRCEKSPSATLYVSQMLWDGDILTLCSLTRQTYVHFLAALWPEDRHASNGIANAER